MIAQKAFLWSLGLVEPKVTFPEKQDSVASLSGSHSLSAGYAGDVRLVNATLKHKNALKTLPVSPRIVSCSRGCNTYSHSPKATGHRRDKLSKGDTFHIGLPVRIRYISYLVSCICWKRVDDGSSTCVPASHVEDTAGISSSCL